MVLGGEVKSAFLIGAAHITYGVPQILLTQAKQALPLIMLCDIALQFVTWQRERRLRIGSCFNDGRLLPLPSLQRPSCAAPQHFAIDRGARCPSCSRGAPAYRHVQRLWRPLNQVA